MMKMTGEDEVGDEDGEGVEGVDDEGELEPEDTLLSDLPHLVFHTIGNCSVKRGVEHTKVGDRKNAKTHTR